MPRRAPDTKAELAKFSLRLPLIFREYFDGIDADSQSVAARKLLAFAVANGGLAACGYKPTQHSAAYMQAAPLPGPSPEPDWAAAWSSEE